MHRWPFTESGPVWSAHVLFGHEEIECEAGCTQWKSSNQVYQDTMKQSELWLPMYTHGCATCMENHRCCLKLWFDQVCSRVVLGCHPNFPFSFGICKAWLGICVQRGCFLNPVRKVTSLSENAVKLPCNKWCIRIRLLDCMCILQTLEHFVGSNFRLEC